MFTRLGHVLLIVAMLAATGSHWAVLQTVAWTNMLADNLGSFALTEAVERTFDGRHPCRLCCQIKEGKKSDRKADFQLDLKRLEFVCERVPLVFSPPHDFRLLPESVFTASCKESKPAVPPPRSFQG